ncbi:MAG: membrane protein insertase YidC [Candidatus Puniceispirillaceae bacterium]
MTPDTRNLIAAASLSMAVLVGWQLYFVEPDLEAQRDAYNAEQTANDLPSSAPESGGAATGQAQVAPGLEKKRIADDARRVAITTPLITGSLTTKGARIDDVVLTAYRESLDEDADDITLLRKISDQQPYFAEFGWIGDNQDVSLPDAQTIWTASSDSLTPDNDVSLMWDNGEGLVFTRTLAIDDQYMITITDEVASTVDEDLRLLPYGLIRRFGTPETTGIYILHEGPIGVVDTTLKENSYGDLRDGVIDYKTEENGGWIGFTDKYWLTALVPDQTVKSNFSMRALSGSEDRYQTDYLGTALVLSQGETIRYQTRFFAGAKVLTMIDAYSDELNIPNFDLAIDFGWFYFLTKPFFYAINWLNGLLGNFGVAILAFTVLIRLVLYPLADKSYRSMAKMRALSPRLTKMREQHKDDRQKLNQEMMALYKQEKVNPAAGCLPILLQIPVFFALYKVLYVSIEMRHAPFFGWIHDLSEVDPTSIFNLFGLLPYSTAMIPDFLNIGIWPIAMGLSMYIQQRLNPPPPDPIQAKIFQWMPIFFTFLLAGFPAGLVIYWTWNNTLSVIQQWWITRQIEKSMKAK